ncbi:hypothetical protein CEXT_719951 [Caerostris extrusa]|uniref:Uncharacterized protein n=1 Tax=Caerostris extrusa TaxID=172846 RepID=A0AAV4VGG2_CAEEX|nr:hypothetical protein CEXT_719951 [Caerostris extrusa]
MTSVESVLSLDAHFRSLPLKLSGTTSILATASPFKMRAKIYWPVSQRNRGWAILERSIPLHPSSSSGTHPHPRLLSPRGSARNPSL